MRRSRRSSYCGQARPNKGKEKKRKKNLPSDPPRGGDLLVQILDSAEGLQRVAEYFLGSSCSSIVTERSRTELYHTAQQKRKRERSCTAVSRTAPHPSTEKKLDACDLILRDDPLI